MRAHHHSVWQLALDIVGSDQAVQADTPVTGLADLLMLCVVCLLHALAWIVRYRSGAGQRLCLRPNAAAPAAARGRPSEACSTVWCCSLPDLLCCRVCRLAPCTTIASVSCSAWLQCGIGALDTRNAMISMTFASNFELTVEFLDVSSYSKTSTAGRAKRESICDLRMACTINIGGMVVVWLPLYLRMNK